MRGVWEEMPLGAGITENGKGSPSAGSGQAFDCVTVRFAHCHSAQDDTSRRRCRSAKDDKL